MSEGQPLPDQDFEDVLQYLKESRGFDFTGYKRTSLMRRVRHRMGQIGVEDYSDYIDQLQVNADEFSVLFNTILINVTAFFRDPEAWAYLRQDVIPTMLAERGPDDPVRVWSAGCASGEEAYSLAIALAEAMGPERFRQQVKIYATDVDDEALSHARHASYVERDLQSLPPELAAKYFEHQNGRYSFRKDLRRSVIFGRNDLVQDAPISRIDLLVCRNTLMYFNQETQARILGRFHFALVPKGVLFLGKAEMLLSHSRIFDPIDLKRRLFRKTATGPHHSANFVSHAMVHDRRVDLRGIDELREHAFSASPVAQIVVTAEDVVALINRQAETTFGLSSKDVGRPLRDVDISYRLQSTNEELETTNEELQSTVEELETTNEELQSTNDELQTINDALRERTGELDRVNEFLESILTSLRAGVIVLDVQMRVLAWNRGAEELWGVRRDEAEGEHLLNLDIGLPVADLCPVVRSALSDGAFMEEVKLSAVNRRGREVVIRVVCSSLRANGGEPDGAILVMEQQER